MRPSAMFVVVLLVLVVSSSAWGNAVPQGGIGVTEPPDSVATLRATSACDTWHDHSSGESFSVYGIHQFYPWADVDIDLLIDDSFAAYPAILDLVTDTEANLLVATIDDETDNLVSQFDTDLGMLFQHFAHSEPGYEYAPDSTRWHFLLYQDCYLNEQTASSHLNHVDIYLFPAAFSSNDPWWREGMGGRYPSFAAVMEEDAPHDEPDSLEWHHNSVSVSDSYGKRVGSSNSSWPLMAAAGVAHEFAHVCWDSNHDTYGTHTSARFRSNPDYNELFACAATHIAGAPPANLIYDVRYGYSLLASGVNCSETTFGDVSLWGERYRLWTMFAAYLSCQFPRPPSSPSIDESLLHRWSTFLYDYGGEEKLEPTFCGLAQVLDDDSEYGYLGYADPGDFDGGYRVSKVFSDYGIARWVDSDSLDIAYTFGSDFSPSVSVGQFRKIISDTVANAVWEFAIPPVLDVTHEHLDTWTRVPDPYDLACPGGWQDSTYGQDYPHGCVPIEVPLWASDYIVFRADTTFYTDTHDDTLFVDFRSDALHEDTELWLSVLTYPSPRDSLFLHGDDLSDLDTYRFRSGAIDTVFAIPDFGEGGSEAVVFVLTLTAQEYSLIVSGSDTSCLRRVPDFVGSCPDLSYSYKYRTGSNYQPPHGCPFVWVETDAGLVESNNIIVPPDAYTSDVQVLAHVPEAAEGEYRLQLTEDGGDTTEFDQVRLLAIDADDGILFGFDEGEEPVPYVADGRILTCRTGSGEDVTDLVLATDDRSVTILPGERLDVVFTITEAQRGGGMGTRGSPGHKIEPPAGGGRGVSEPGVLDLQAMCYRANPQFQVLPLPADCLQGDGTGRLSITAPVEFSVDELVPATMADSEIVVTECDLAGATHDVAGNSHEAVLSADGQPVRLAPGEAMMLSFRVPDQARHTTRTLAFAAIARDAVSSRVTPALTADDGVLTTASVYPNPSRGIARIAYDVPADGMAVAVRVYSVSGRLVRTLRQATDRRGTYELEWNGRDDAGEVVASGVYFCRVLLDGQEQTKKLLVLR